MKFEIKINSELSDAVLILDRIKKLSNLCGQTLSKILQQRENEMEKIFGTGLQFNRSNYEAMDAIMMLLKEGHISESIVLLRWHLEMGQLLYYLVNNRPEFEKWLQGKQINPGTTRKYIKKAKYNDWFETYKDMCDVVHGNSNHIENCHIIAKMNPITEGQFLIVSWTIRNLMYTTQRITFVILILLKQTMSVSNHNKLVQEHNELDDLIDEFSKKYNKKETKLLNNL